MRTKLGMPQWAVGVIVTAFFAFITTTGTLDFTEPFEKKAFDFRVRLTAPAERNQDIEIVAVTQDDMLELGRFPLARDLLAEAVRNLSAAGAEVIAINFVLSEADQNDGLETLRELRKKYESHGLAQQGPGLEFYRDLALAEDGLDKDLQLYNAITGAGNVVLPVTFDTTPGGIDQEPPEFIDKFALRNARGAGDALGVSGTIRLDRVTPLLPLFAEAAFGIGHLNLFKDSDGVLRDQVHVINYRGKTFFPSFPMAIVKAFKGLESDDIVVYPGHGIRVMTSPFDFVHLPVRDQRMSTLMNWNRGPDAAFRHTRFTDLLRNQIDTSVFLDKIVIIGPTTAHGIGELFETPVSPRLPGVEVVANAVSSILDQRFYSRPGWIGFLELGIIIVFGLFISAALPRLSSGMGTFTTICLLSGYAGIGIVLFYSSRIWLYVTPAIMLLVAGYVLVISWRLLYDLGPKFERKGRFSKTMAPYDLTGEPGESLRDSNESFPPKKVTEATIALGPGEGHPVDTGINTWGTDTKPTLGRYEVKEELGRGSMGVVYRGVDPKIHRTVAIKTVHISDFDEDKVDEMKERFFREAESAGLLTHPNIVTIYDAGDEHDLAYIAMEFLEGENLESMVKKGNHIPMHLAVHFAAQVADALNYAHERGIVHRDIKPANIMRLRGTDTVKVTDFGIARITSSSKTRTGVVLGTPSYMSPEQVEGKKVDGRSDIFSLGVVLYEMLTGEKPFRGEDITSLMYQIAREPHFSPRSINPRIPPVVEKIINKALQKDAEKRYQKAGHMSGHLKKVVEKMRELQARKNVVVG